jgi:hypothetical protein
LWGCKTNAIPRDESLTTLGDTIAEARADGLSVMVRPLIDFFDPSLIGSYRPVQTIPISRFLVGRAAAGCKLRGLL